MWLQEEGAEAFPRDRGESVAEEDRDHHERHYEEPVQDHRGPEGEAASLEDRGALRDHQALEEWLRLGGTRRLKWPCDSGWRH